MLRCTILKFPSPYGVLFILILEIKYIADKTAVSVSLRSIIHSYMKKVFKLVKNDACFRLLTEYYSFLSEVLMLNNFNRLVSVSLRSIIHSYLM